MNVSWFSNSPISYNSEIFLPELSIDSMVHQYCSGTYEYAKNEFHHSQGLLFLNKMAYFFHSCEIPRFFLCSEFQLPNRCAGVESFGHLSFGTELHPHRPHRDHIMGIVLDRQERRAGSCQPIIYDSAHIVYYGTKWDNSSVERILYNKWTNELVMCRCRYLWFAFS